MSDYKVFTREHDMVLDAAWLMAHPDFEPFRTGRAELDAAADARKLVSNLSSREEVMRSIMDAGADHPGSHYPDLSDVDVAILVDQSGSQRGRENRRNEMAAFVDRAVEVLDMMGAETEVLGFTTLWWKGGDIRQKWIDAGRPAGPGRLNALLHIVYKEADALWGLDLDGPSPRACFDAIYRHPYMREGIDGEAVEWATGRLSARGRGNKILLVASDCAPIDDATMSVNHDGLLENHLKEAVAAAESAGIRVVAVSNGLWRSLSDRDVPKRTFYDNLLYAADHDGFDAREATVALMRDIAANIEPQATPKP